MSIFDKFLRRTPAGEKEPLVEDDFSKRRTLFTVGSKYRVSKDTVTANWSFVAGEEVEFVAAGYSRYDSDWVFTFRSLSSGEQRSWLLHDDEPIALALEVFVAVDRR